MVWKFRVRLFNNIGIFFCEWKIGVPPFESASLHSGWYKFFMYSHVLRPFVCTWMNAILVGWRFRCSQRQCFVHLRDTVGECDVIFGPIQTLVLKCLHSSALHLCSNSVYIIDPSKRIRATNNNARSNKPCVQLMR